MPLAAFTGSLLPGAVEAAGVLVKAGFKLVVVNSDDTAREFSGKESVIIMIILSKCTLSREVLMMINAYVSFSCVVHTQLPIFHMKQYPHHQILLPIN